MRIDERVLKRLQETGQAWTPRHHYQITFDISGMACIYRTDRKTLTGGALPYGRFYIYRLSRLDMKYDRVALYDCKTFFDVLQAISKMSISGKYFLDLYDIIHQTYVPYLLIDFDSKTITPFKTAHFALKGIEQYYEN